MLRPNLEHTSWPIQREDLAVSQVAADNGFVTERHNLDNVVHSGDLDNRGMNVRPRGAGDSRHPCRRQDGQSEAPHDSDRHDGELSAPVSSNAKRWAPAPLEGAASSAACAICSETQRPSGSLRLSDDATRNAAEVQRCHIGRGHRRLITDACSVSNERVQAQPQAAADPARPLRTLGRRSWPAALDSAVLLTRDQKLRRPPSTGFQNDLPKSCVQ